MRRGKKMYHYKLSTKILIIFGLLVFPFIIFTVFEELGVFLEIFSLFIGIPVSLFLMIKKPKSKQEQAKKQKSIKTLLINENNIETAKVSVVKDTQEIVTSPTQKNEIRNHIPYISDFNKTILLDRLSKKPQLIPEDIMSYPLSLKEALGIINPHREYLKLIDEGYVIESKLESKLILLDKEQLLSICSELNLLTKGTKKDLVSRIITVTNNEFVINKFLGQYKYYELSEIGLKFIQENDDYIKLYRSNQYSKPRYIQIRTELIAKGIQPRFEEIAYILCKENIKEETKEKKYESLSFSYRNLSELCWILEKNEEGINYLIFAFILTLSCLSNWGNIFNPDYIKPLLKNYAKISNFEVNVVEDIIDSLLAKIKLPYQKYPNDILKILVLEYYSNGTIDFDRYWKYEIKPKYVTDYGDFWKDPLKDL